jgi:L-lactate dehydrogenase complex protein LldG
MSQSRSRFETSLDELGVSITVSTETSLPADIDDVITTPAVGVALGEALGLDANPLTETAVAVDPTPAALRQATTGVTAATLAVADYGSLVLTMDDRASELVSLFVDEHVILLRERDLMSGLEATVDAVERRVTESSESAIIATGPSATADMGELILGAHGPKEVHLIVIEEGA